MAVVTRALRSLVVLGLFACAAPRVAEQPLGESDRLIGQALEVEAEDPHEARRLAEQAAATGDPEALNLLGIYLRTGIGGEKDERRGAELLEEAASRGSIGARLSLGTQLVHSDSPSDQRRGVDLLTPLLERSDSASIFAASSLGKAHLLGLGVEQDMQRGVDLLVLADSSFEADDSVLYLLGRTYENGWGSRPRDPARSFGYFKRAAEKGNARAAWYTGMALLNGEGVPKDESAAYSWVRKAGDGGELRGEISTAVMLALGQGVEEDDREARRWYEKAVAKNSAHAMRGLGAMLMTGEGGPVDAPRGLAYLRMAAEVGEAEARRLLALVEPGTPEAVREAAAKLEAEWLAEHGPPALVE